MIKQSKRTTLLNSIDLAIDLDEEEFYTECLENQLEHLNYNLYQFVKEYEKRYKTKIAAYAFVGERFSPYGMIGGNNQICGTSSENMQLEEVLYGCDDFAFNITEDKHLELIKMDHDGSNSMDLRLITQNEYETYKTYLDDYLNLAEFVYKLGKNPTKLSKAFYHIYDEILEEVKL